MIGLAREELMGLGGISIPKSRSIYFFIFALFFLPPQSSKDFPQNKKAALLRRLL